jgi:hypothetical protein
MVNVPLWLSWEWLLQARTLQRFLGGRTALKHLTAPCRCAASGSVLLCIAVECDVYLINDNSALRIQRCSEVSTGGHRQTQAR